MKKTIFIIVILLLISTGTLLYYKLTPKAVNSSGDINSNEIENCKNIIAMYYKGLDTKDYKTSYDYLYPLKFAKYEDISIFWEQSFNAITVNSIVETPRQNATNSAEYYFKVELLIDYKDNPSRFVTDDPTDGNKITYVKMKKDENNSWKIYEFMSNL